MRALIQRVGQASVTVLGPSGEGLGGIGLGLLVFLGIAAGDGPDEARYLAEKVLNLRIFDDEAGRFNRSALDVGAELLLVSQFTLYADTRKGRRPSFTHAAPPGEAEPLYQKAVALFRESGLRVATGRFAEEMTVSLENDGPVTILIDSADMARPRRA